MILLTTEPIEFFILGKLHIGPAMFLGNFLNVSLRMVLAAFKWSGEGIVDPSLSILILKINKNLMGGIFFGRFSRKHNGSTLLLNSYKPSLDL